MFAVDPATGALPVRFSARSRRIVRRDDAATRSAVACLEELPAARDGPVIRCRPAAGQGIIANDVLHNRAAFRDDPENQRPVYRPRFPDRVAGRGARDAT